MATALIKKQVYSLLGLPLLQPGVDFQKGVSRIFLGDVHDRAQSIRLLRDAVIQSNMEIDKKEIRTFGKLSLIQPPFIKRLQLTYWENSERTVVWKRILKTTLVAGCILLANVVGYAFSKGALSFKQNRLICVMFFLLNAVAVGKNVLYYKTLKQRTKTELEKTLEEVVFQEIVSKPSSNSQVLGSELGNEKGEDYYSSPILFEEIPEGEIGCPRYILIGNNLFPVQEALLTMFARENCFNKEIPHPMEERSLSEKEQSAFLDTLKDLLCIRDESAFLDLWDVDQTLLNEYETRIREDLVYMQLDDDMKKVEVMEAVKNEVACYIRVTKFYHLIGQNTFNKSFGDMKDYVIQENTRVKFETPKGDVVIHLQAG